METIAEESTWQNENGKFYGLMIKEGKHFAGNNKVLSFHNGRKQMQQDKLQNTQSFAWMREIGYHLAGDDSPPV